MKKSIFSLAMLFASALSAFAATEADFNTARDQAVAKMTSWAAATPYAEESLAQGMANLINAQFSSYSSADAAVSGIKKIVDETLDLARTEMEGNLYRIFTTMTTEGLQANPYNGAYKVGSAYAEDDEGYMEWHANGVMKFEAYAKTCASCTWTFFSVDRGARGWGLRNSRGLFLRSPDMNQDGSYPDEDLWVDPFCRASSHPDQHYFTLDFADDGGMKLTYGGHVVATNAEGRPVFADSYGAPETRWIFSRITDPKFDLPKLSTKENPIYYVIRNAAHPDQTLLAGPNLTGDSYMHLGPFGETSRWYFTYFPGVDFGAYCAYNANGSYIARNLNPHMYTTWNTNIGANFFLLPTGYEELGVSINMYATGERAMDRFNNCYWTTCFHDYVDVNWKKYANEPDPEFAWFFEEAGGAEVTTFLNLKKEFTAKLEHFKEIQPWANKQIDAAIETINGLDFNNYNDITVARDDMEKAFNDVADHLLDFMAADIAIKGNNTVYLINKDRYNANSADGWMLTVDNNTLTATTDNLPDDNSIWYFEAVPGAANTYTLHNPNGAYIAERNKAWEYPVTTDASKAGKFVLALQDGYFSLSIGSAALNFSPDGGSALADLVTSPGSTWLLKRVAKIDGELPVISPSMDVTDQLYVLRSPEEPYKFLECYGDRFFVAAGNSQTPRTYWYFAKSTTPGATYVCSDFFRGSRLRIGHEFEVPENVVTYTPGFTDVDFDWYIIPVEYNGKLCYQISSCYPPVGDCCIARPAAGTSAVYASADDLKNTAWICDPQEAVDHEAIFQAHKNPYVGEIDSYLKIQPWAVEILTDARDRLANATMTDFGGDSDSANSALDWYIVDVRNNANFALEDDADDWTVSIINKRLNELDKPAYLSAVDGFANMEASRSAASTWTFRYVNNGRFRLVNADGLYLGPLSDDVIVTENESEAGFYAPFIGGGCFRLVNRNNPAEGLNIDTAGHNACVYSTEDAGSQWIIADGTDALPEIGLGTSQCPVQVFDARGIRVDNAILTPGVYFKRQGSKVTKFIVK